MNFRFTAWIWIALDCYQFSCHMRSIDCVSIAIVSSVGHVTKVKSTTLLFTLKSTHKPFGAHVLNNIFETIWQCDYTVVLYFIAMLLIFNKFIINTINFKFFFSQFSSFKNFVSTHDVLFNFEVICFSKINFFFGTAQPLFFLIF